MAFAPSFSIATSIDSSAIILQDTSTGSDGAIASRSILLYQVSNSLLVPAISWALATNPITINPLTQDIALNIVINWLDGSGNILYTTNQIYAFVGNTNLFLYRLTEAQGSNPNISQDTNYYSNKMQLFTEVLSAQNAISTGSDVFAAQQCIQRATYMINNQNLFF